ncbi:hypothetical protein [Microvirga tunisiensis]|uniref:Uncharacterized protein n=1 Tax=Microvirga tunisiensis TaxID=2108360 RepID=A0A5N7MW44_9HYPH|nr:hypothetical protein [Microvirga tunisiensis]MPR13345.1 hypothetical protein [Microvirga tunisiensis]MPR31215.1 hypothetical protein [Microvirga tunisiensis]
MADPINSFDLMEFEDSSFVLHFGGRSSQIRARTLGSTLQAFSDLLSAINAVIDPESEIELVVDAEGRGSYRLRLRATKNPTGKYFDKADKKSALINTVSGVAAGLVLLLFQPSGETTVINNVYHFPGAVIVQRDDMSITMPEATYKAVQAVETNTAVLKQVAKMMKALEADPNVTSFGLTGRLTDDFPAVEIPRTAFPTIRKQANSLAKPTIASTPRADTAKPIEQDLNNPLSVSEPRQSPLRLERRTVEPIAKLTVVDPHLNRPNAAWDLIFDGFRIEAPIQDREFLSRVANGAKAVRVGDQFEATLRIHQVRDPTTGDWINETFEVQKVTQPSQVTTAPESQNREN